MGLLMAGSYLANSVVDWWLGRRLMKRIRSARGAGRLQLFGFVLSSGALLSFGLAALAPPGSRLAAALVALLTFRLSYALYDLPQNALLALAGRDERERSRMTAARLALALTGLGYGAGTGGLFFMLWSAIARRAANIHGGRGVTAALGTFAAAAKLGAGQRDPGCRALSSTTARARRTALRNATCQHHGRGRLRTGRSDPFVRHLPSIACMTTQRS